MDLQVEVYSFFYDYENTHDGYEYR